MRELKFRAWHKDDEVMLDVEGITFLDDCIDVHFEDESTTRCVLMQSTGLKDKNGKEVFEGDILKRGRDKLPDKNKGEWIFVAKIVFSNGAFRGITIPNANHCIPIEKLSACDSDGNGYDEIIGNIYENPELSPKQDAE